MINQVTSMTSKPSVPIDPIYEFTLRVKLVFVLLKEKTISPLVKILPFLGVIYLFLPIKILFPFDFLLVLFLGGYLFIEFCPQKTVAENLEKLRNVIPGKAKPVPPKDGGSSKPVNPEEESVSPAPKP
jgi:hypothetical protein